MASESRPKRGRPSLLESRRADVAARRAPSPVAEERSGEASGHRSDALVMAGQSLAQRSGADSRRLVPIHVLSACARRLRVASHPLAEYVSAAACAPLGDTSPLEGVLKYISDVWSPASSVWHYSSLAAAAASSDVHRNTLRRAERRVAAAAEVLERAGAAELQAVTAPAETTFDSPQSAKIPGINQSTCLRLYGK